MHMLRIVLFLFPCLIAIDGRAQGCTLPVTELRNGQNDTLAMPPPPAPSPADTLQVAEAMPQFPGGEAAMMAHFQRGVRYPSGCEEVEGKVYLGFVVDVDGSILSLKVLRGMAACPAMDDEAMRVARTMPAWVPGCQNGRTVLVRMAIPVRFRRM